MSDPAKPDPEDGSSGRVPTPVPPRAGKSEGGAKQPAGNRPPAARAAKGRQARQAAQRRNRLTALLAVVAAAAVVAVIVIIGVTGSSHNGSARQPATAAAVHQMDSVPLQAMVTGLGKVTAGNLVYANPATGGALTSGAKPELLYVGAEFCPICGAERWPMTLALMKFGTFTGLKQTHSAKQDGDVGTWSYYGSTYTSPYLTFVPYEVEENQPYPNYKKLDTPPSSVATIWSQNQPSGQSFPFIDFNGKEILQSAQFNPTVVEFKSFNDILSTVGTNDNTIGAYINASAAVFTKYICGITNDQPGNVCSAVANVRLVNLSRDQLQEHLQGPGAAQAGYCEARVGYVPVGEADGYLGVHVEGGG